jgi:hypothetical protein
MFVMPANYQVPNTEKYSVSFNGVDEVMGTSDALSDVENARYFDTDTRKLSISSWFRSDGTVNVTGFIFLYQGNNVGEQIREIDLRIYQGGGGTEATLISFVFNSGGAAQKSQQFTNVIDRDSDEWHLVVATYDEDELMPNGNQGVLRFYLDGELLTNPSPETNEDYNPTGTFSDDSLLSVGADVLVASYAKVSVYDSAIWDTLLGPAEIKAMYNGGRPIDYRVNQQRYESAANLTYWWTPKYDGDTADQDDSMGRPTVNKYGSKSHDWADLMRYAANISVADDRVKASPWSNL